MGENPVWQSFLCGKKKRKRKKKERKRKADARQMHLKPICFCPADNRKSHKFISPG